MMTKLRGWMVLAALLGTAVYCLAEELTLTTYYPSPRGVYNELRVEGNLGIGTSTPGTAPFVIVKQGEPFAGAGGGGSLQMGVSTIPVGGDRNSWLQVYNGPIMLQPIGNAVGIGYGLDTYIPSTNGKLMVNGNVGIGTMAPGDNERLHVRAAGGTGNTYGLIISNSAGNNKFWVEDDGDVWTNGRTTMRELRVTDFDPNLHEAKLQVCYGQGCCEANGLGDTLHVSSTNSNHRLCVRMNP